MTSKRKMILTVGLMALSLTACSGEGSKPAPKPVKAEVKYPTTNRGTSVKPVLLSDGTPCATINSVNGAEVSCDWLAPKQNASGHQPKTTRGSGVKLVVMPNGMPCAVVEAGGEGSPGIDCGPIPIKE
jgi:hypothetical protein